MARVTLIDTTVNREAVKTIRDLLKRIEAGEISAVAYTAVTGATTVEVGIAEGRNAHMLAQGIEKLSAKLLERSKS